MHCIQCGDLSGTCAHDKPGGMKMLAVGTRVKVKGVSESGVYVDGIGTVTEAYYEVRMSDGRCRLMDECAVREYR